MSIIKEVADGIDLISSSISNIKTIVDTVKDGKGYLENRYKEAKSDVIMMLQEMNKTLSTISRATSIITHFSFVNDPGHFASDLREFNNRIIDTKAEIDTLEQNIHDYRGHCSVIRNHAQKIKDGNKLDYLFMIFGVDSKEKNEELSFRLQTIYDDERNHYMAVFAICNNLRLAIDDVHHALGGPGMIDPANVPAAAALLREYSEIFLMLEKEAKKNHEEIRELTLELS